MQSAWAFSDHGVFVYGGVTSLEGNPRYLTDVWISRDATFKSFRCVAATAILPGVEQLPSFGFGRGLVADDSVFLFGGEVYDETKDLSAGISKNTFNTYGEDGARDILISVYGDLKNLGHGALMDIYGPVVVHPACDAAGTSAQTGEANQCSEGQTIAAPQELGVLDPLQIIMSEDIHDLSGFQIELEPAVGSSESTSVVTSSFRLERRRQILTWVPLQPMLNGRTYHIVDRTRDAKGEYHSIEDHARNGILQKSLNIAFTVANDIDTPTVHTGASSSTYPADGATKVPPQTNVLIEFYEDVEAGRIDGLTLDLVPVEGDVVSMAISKIVKSKVWFRMPDDMRLTAGQDYTMQLPQGLVVDLTGNENLPQNASTFMVQSGSIARSHLPYATGLAIPTDQAPYNLACEAHDNATPILLATLPAQSSTDVPTRSTLSLRFDRPVKLGTSTSARLAIERAAHDILISMSPQNGDTLKLTTGAAVSENTWTVGAQEIISLRDGGRIVVLSVFLTHLEWLKQNQYTAQIDPDFFVDACTGENALSEKLDLQFTSLAEYVDDVAPQVLLTDPALPQTTVPFEKLQLFLSKPVTIQNQHVMFGTQTLTLSQPYGTSVRDLVTVNLPSGFDANQNRIVPDGTLTIGSGATQDLHG